MISLTQTIKFEYNNSLVIYRPKFITLRIFSFKVGDSRMSTIIPVSELYSRRKLIQLREDTRRIPESMLSDLLFELGGEVQDPQEGKS